MARSMKITISAQNIGSIPLKNSNIFKAHEAEFWEVMQRKISSGAVLNEKYAQ